MESPRGLVANVLDWNLLVFKFELQSRYSVITLRKVWNNLFQPDMEWITQLLSFLNDCFSIRKYTKIDMPLNKETKYLLILWDKKL